MDLRRKVVAALIGVGVVTTGLSAWMLDEAVQSRNDVARYHSRDSQLVDAVDDMHSTFLGYDGGLNMYVLVASGQHPDARLVADTLAAAQEYKQSFDKRLGAALSIAEDPQLVGQLQQVSGTIQSYAAYAG
jgi:hypothetical protein